MLSANKLVITPEMLIQISSIDEFKGAWAALEKHTTALNLLGDVAHFGQNFREVISPLRHKSINADMLVKLHQLAAREPNAAGFKNTMNSISVYKENKLIGELETATPDEVRALIESLLSWLEKSLTEDNFHPLLVIALFCAIFLQIGPFDTGNQKLMRLMITLLMLRAGYEYAPYISIEQILQERSAAYYNALAKVNANIAEGRADFQPWIIFFLNCLTEQKDMLHDRMVRASKKITGMPSLSVRVMKLFENNDRLQMKDIERLTKGRRSTLKLRLNELVDEGYLIRHGQARSTWYSRV
jgi:Fic family protein